jgi:hypothetical protein
MVAPDIFGETASQQVLPERDGRNPIQAESTPRMAAHNAQSGDSAALEKAVLLQRTYGVLGTGGIVATSSFSAAEQALYRRDSPLVNANAEDAQVLHFPGIRCDDGRLFLFFICRESGLCLLIKVVLQDDAGGCLINNSAAVAHGSAGLMERSLGFYGAEALIDKDDVNALIDPRAQALGERFYFVHCRAFCAVKAQGKSHDDFIDTLLARDLCNPRFRTLDFGGYHRFQWMSHHPEIVADGQPNPCISVVNSKCTHNQKKYEC